MNAPPGSPPILTGQLPPNDMKPELLVAILTSIGRIGLEATAIILERLGKPGATIDDAIKACRDAQAKTLQQFKDEV